MHAMNRAPGCEFSDGVLHVRTPSETVRIRWRPAPRAEKLVPCRGCFRVCWPDFRILRQPDDGGTCEPYALDIPTQGETPAAAELRKAALAAFRSEVPADIARIAEPFVSHQWALMVLLHEQPQAMDLAAVNPVLAHALADSSQLRGTSRELAALHAVWNSRKKQREILKWLGFPDSEAMVRLFRKMSPGSVSPPVLRLFRNAVAADGRVQELLAHLPAVSAAVLELVINPKVINVVTPKLLQEVAGNGRTHSGQSLADTILASLDLALKMGRQAKPFSSVKQVRRFQEETDALYQAHLRGRHTTAEERRVAAEHARQRRLEEERVRLRRLREHQAELAKLAMLPFPRPPVPGTAAIMPITSRAQLDAEGRSQRNCVGCYWWQVVKGGMYIYRVTAPERATLALVPCADGTWRRSQIAKSDNRAVKPETVEAVDKWLGQHWMRE